MTRRRQVYGTLALVALAAIPLAIASAAWACARLATVKLDRAKARPGTELTIIGRNFTTAPGASPVAVRFNSRTGRVVWEGRPDARGRFKGTFTVPDAARGHYVIVATQQTAEGRPAAGTPGRAPLKVRARRRARSEVAPPPAGLTAPAPPSGPPAALLAGLLVVGLTSGALALGAGSRQRRPTAAS